MALQEPQQANQRWQVGGVFTVPLTDGSQGLGQVVGVEPHVLNSVSCAFFALRFRRDAEELPCLRLEDVISVLFTTRDLLDSGRWRVVGASEPQITCDLLPYERLRSSGFVGAKVIGSKNVAAFLSAYHGLVPWDDWADPKYLDRLLLSPEKKPGNLMYESE